MPFVLSAEIEFGRKMATREHVAVLALNEKIWNHLVLVYILWILTNFSLTF